MTRSLQSLFDRAAEFKKQRRLDEAIRLYERAAREHPRSAAAEHNLAGALGDAGRGGESEVHIRRAFERGADKPASWLVLARALMMQGKLDEARDAYRRTLEINPGVLDAHRELAQLTWMTTGDRALALEPLDAALRSAPDVPALHVVKAQVLRFTADAETMLAFVRKALSRWPDDAGLLDLAVDAATRAGEPGEGLELSERLLRLQPQSMQATGVRICALLAGGRATEALPLAETLVAASGNDQYAYALLATTCRLVGDERHPQLYDYERLVRPYDLSAPKGWDTAAAYLGELASALRSRHRYKAHPFANSLHGGSMISGLPGMDDPAIRALPDAIAPAVDAHVEYLGSGPDPVRSRNTRKWAIDGLWSVYLQPNGFHHDHVHPNGWISSALYIELPGRLGAAGHEGWIKFGEPGIVTTPKLGHEHAVRPQPGRVVLFPSYMWHGTVPFGGNEPRLTVAFDIVPA